MKIETEFNIGDYVYCLENSSVAKAEIRDISINVFISGEGKPSRAVKYQCVSIDDPDEMWFYKYEPNVFGTKEELLNSLEIEIDCLDDFHKSYPGGCHEFNK